MNKRPRFREAWALGKLFAFCGIGDLVGRSDTGVYHGDDLLLILICEGVAAVAVIGAQSRSVDLGQRLICEHRVQCVAGKRLAQIAQMVQVGMQQVLLCIERTGILDSRAEGMIASMSLRLRT